MPRNTITSKATDAASLSELRQVWRQSLTAPQDGMWEIFRDSAEHWIFTTDGQIIGYACANEEYGLLQFYLSPVWQHERGDTLKDFLEREGIT